MYIFFSFLRTAFYPILLDKDFNPANFLRLFVTKEQRKHFDGYQPNLKTCGLSEDRKHYMNDIMVFIKK